MWFAPPRRLAATALERLEMEDRCKHGIATCRGVPYTYSRALDRSVPLESFAMVGACVCFYLYVAQWRRCPWTTPDGGREAVCYAGVCRVERRRHAQGDRLRQLHLEHFWGAAKKQKVAEATKIALIRQMQEFT